MPCEDCTYIPPALVQRPDLLERAAHVKRLRKVTWRGLEASLGTYGLTGGSAADYRSIVQFMAALETRRIETGSYNVL